MRPDPSRRAPTILDVARVAKVSVPTVSRVLTGSVPVGTTLRTRVMAAIEQLDYRPNAAARALVSGRQSMVAVITGNTSRYGYATTVQGIEEAARAAGFIVLIAVIETTEQAVVRDAVDLVVGQPIAGIVVLDFDDQGRAALAMMPTTVPVVAAGASPMRGSPVPRAYLGDFGGAREATAYLLSLGHQTVYHVALPDAGRKGGRTAGWRETLRSAGARVPEPLVASWHPDDGHKAGRILAANDDVTAILCGNDEMAFGVIRAMSEHGRRVPEDVSVIGFDDQPLARLWSPSLTSVAQDFVELGRRTFALLHQRIEHGGGRSSVRMSAHLVIRESTARAIAPRPPRRTR